MKTFEFHWISMNSIAFRWRLWFSMIFRGSNGFQWMLMSFIDCHWMSWIFIDAFINLHWGFIQDLTYLQAKILFNLCSKFALFSLKSLQSVGENCIVLSWRKEWRYFRIWFQWSIEKYQSYGCKTLEFWWNCQFQRRYRLRECR